MKNRLKAFVKRNRWCYRLYFSVGSALLRLLGCFVKTDPDLILFISYGGQKYDDSPRVVYEYLKTHPVSGRQRYVWAFTQPERYPQIEQRVKVDTLLYFITALRAGCWITNASASRGLHFQKKETRSYLFEHGVCAIKKIGADIGRPDKAFQIGFHEKFDAVFIEGKQELSILPRAWGMAPSVFHLTGLPRNDDLTAVSDDELHAIRAKLGIPDGKRVILYAPTFREFSRAADGQNALGIPLNFARWENELGREYVLLVTAHYEVAQLLNTLPQTGFVINAFQYPVLNDLLKAADILISDYSSIVFDYAILERPIFCYAYDLDTYVTERGLYADLNTLFSHGALRTEETLLAALREIDYSAECDFTREHIKNKYIASYGNAAEKAVAVMFPNTDGK